MNSKRELFTHDPETFRRNEHFWAWFQENEKDFHRVVKAHEHIEKDFFDKLSPKLAELREGYYFLTGMLNDETVDLIFTADGNIKNIAFIEDLVAQAPKIDGWQITAMKPAIDIDRLGIRMGSYNFNSYNLFFYANDHADYPDQIDISVVHEDLNAENREVVSNGTFIFLDNFLGELDFVNNIDNLEIIPKGEATQELVPIAKLKDFLIWRQKEFVEKYENLTYESEDDSFTMMEAELQNGNQLLAIIKTDLLEWDNKASHPWIGVMIIKYDGDENRGLPNEKDLDLLNKMEDEMFEVLLAEHGDLYVGRQMVESEKEIYYACKDYRQASKIFSAFQQKYAADFEIHYDFYKDKYWQSFERFLQI